MIDPMTVLKLPWRMVTAAFRWAVGIATAPGRVRKLEAQLAGQQDPRPICAACGKGRVSVEHYDKSGNNRVVPVTSGHCDNADCQALWRLTSSGDRLVNRLME